MGAQISTLRDDFTDNSLATAWDAFVGGSASVAETGGQLVVTLPSSTAGAHSAGVSTPSTYNLTGDDFYINIATMVSTAVAATAYYELRLTRTTQTNVLRWVQVSGTLSAQQIIAGVTGTLFSIAWSATTYKYLRIREAGGSVFWDSSTNGTTWTNRATSANPFAVTDLYVVLFASCSNVASPGTFKLDSVNLILPALATNWRWQQIVWPLTERFKVVTLACDVAGTVQGYIVTADAVDASDNPSGSVQYWSGPANGGRELTLCATQAQAQAMAVDLPLDGRFDLPTMTEARCIRVYDRSVDGGSFILREAYARRLIQTDDLEAESVRAINIAASAITADKLDVTLTITGHNIQTDYNGARVVLSGDAFGGFIGYNATDTYNTLTGTGTYQVFWNAADGVFYAGAGVVYLGAGGISVATSNSLESARSYKFRNSGGAELGGLYAYDVGTNQPFFVFLQALPLSGKDSVIYQNAMGIDGKVGQITLIANDSIAGGDGAIVELQYSNSVNTITIGGSAGNTDTTIYGGLNVGAAAGATAGQILTTVADAGTTNTPAILITNHSSSGTPAAGFGSASKWHLKDSSTDNLDAFQINVTWVTATHGSQKARVQFFAFDTAAREGLRIEASGTAPMLGFFGAAAAVKPAPTGSRAGNAALASLLTALAGMGLITDSTSA